MDPRLRHLPEAERAAARDLLDLPQRGGQLQLTGERQHVYHEDRPRELVEFFAGAARAIADLEAERVVTTSGRVEFPVRPTAPPTLNAYAASVGVSRRTLHRWGHKHPAFREALERTKAIQAACVERLAAIGSLAAPTAAILLKHLADVTDRLEVEVSRGTGMVAIPPGTFPPGTRASDVQAYDPRLDDLLHPEDREMEEIPEGTSPEQLVVDGSDGICPRYHGNPNGTSPGALLVFSNGARVLLDEADCQA